MGSPSYRDTALSSPNQSHNTILPNYSDEKEALPTSSNAQQRNLPGRHVTFQTPLPSKEHDAHTTAGHQNEAEDGRSNPDTTNIPVIARNAAYPVWLAPLTNDRARGGWSIDRASSSAKRVEVARPSTSTGRIPTTAELLASNTELSGDKWRDIAGSAAAPAKDGEQRREFILQQRLKASEGDISKLRQESFDMRVHLTQMIHLCLLQGSGNATEVGPREDGGRSSASENKTDASLDWLSAFETQTNWQLMQLLRNEIKSLKVEVDKSQTLVEDQEAALEAKGHKMGKIQADCESALKQERETHEELRKSSRETARMLEVFERAHGFANAKIKELTEQLNNAIRTRVYDIDKLNAAYDDKLYRKEREMKLQKEKSATEAAGKETKIAELKSYINDMEKTNVADTVAREIEITNKTKDLSDLKKTIDEMREQLQHGAEQKRKLEETIERVGKENEVFEKSLNMKSDLLNRATTELKRKHEELADRTPDLERKTKELKAKDDELKRQVEANRWSKGQVSWYKHQYDTSHREVEVQRNQVTELSSKHHQINLEVSELNNKTHILLKRLKGAEEENENLKKTLSMLRKNGSQARNEKVVSATSNPLSTAGAAGSQSESETTTQASEEDSDTTDEDGYYHLEGSFSGDESYAML